jgi:hypothetical protein
MFLNRIANLTIGRSLIFLGNVLESLQKSRVNVDRKSAYLRIGSIFLLYPCVKGPGPLCPSPKKAAPSLPMPKGLMLTHSFLGRL